MRKIVIFMFAAPLTGVENLGLPGVNNVKCRDIDSGIIGNLHPISSREIRSIFILTATMDLPSAVGNLYNALETCDLRLANKPQQN